MRLNRPKYITYAVGESPDLSYFDVCELKFDGIWGQLSIEGREWKIYSRTGELKRSGKLSKSFESTLIHGEFLFGSEWSKDREDLYYKLAAFDAVRLNGIELKDIPQFAVREAISYFLKHIEDEEIVGGVFLVDQFPAKDYKNVWDKYVEVEKYEGLIFKNSDSGWGSDMGRMKQVATMDYVCIDVIESDSATYKGWGAKSISAGLYVGGELVRKCSIPGMTDEQRKEFLENKDMYIGKVLECRGKKISKKGAIRHPEFVRWREDKLPEECIWSF